MKENVIALTSIALTELHFLGHQALSMQEHRGQVQPADHHIRLDGVGHQIGHKHALEVDAVIQPDRRAVA